MVISSGMALPLNFAPPGFMVDFEISNNYQLEFDHLIALVDNQMFGEIESLALSLAFSFPAGLTAVEMETLMASYSLLSDGLKALMTFQMNLMLQLTGKVWRIFEKCLLPLF